MTRGQKVAFGFCAAAILAAVGAFALRRSAAEPAATQPSIVLAPDVHALLDQVRQAYASVGTLSASGTFKSRLDIDGVQKNGNAEFTGLYSSAGLFRNETKEHSDANPASADAPATTDVVLGSNGTNIYLYFPSRQRYQMVDAPKGKVTLDTIGDDAADILRNQNLSLALALSPDAESELLQDAVSATRVDDVKIDGQACPTLLILHPMFDQTLVIDPRNHLVRQLTDDVSKNARMKGAREIKSALLTADFANSPAKPIPASQFAWAPPAGAQEVTPANVASDLVGKPAPPFSLTDLNGQQVTSQSLAGTVYLLDFWASWCGPCVASLPHLDAIYKDFKDKGVRFFAVNEQEDKPVVQKFVADSRLSIPVLLDPDAKLGSIYDPDMMIPLTAVVGKDGKVVAADHMAGAEDQLRTIITDALKK
jgi:thiol-disulfide isomerase/thioredoxin